MARGISLVKIYIYLAFVIVIVAADDEACDKTKCPGPLRYYNLLGCQPIYEKEGDCCAKKYNCDHLKERATNKCYMNSNVYDINEILKPEDTNPCDKGCICRPDSKGYASFLCAIVDCFTPPTKPGCYRKRSATDCCAGEEVCPEKEENRPTCTVDGKTYKDGEHFSVKDDPDLNCICQPGYEGKNVEPFCVRPKHSYCTPEFHASNIYEKCAPVYASSQSPQSDCHFENRCQNSNDTVIHNHDDHESGETHDEENVCEFGKLKMHINDELNQATDYSSVCVKCVCEVPPIPTCQRLPDNECDITNHPPFEQY